MLTTEEITPDRADDPTSDDKFHISSKQFEADPPFPFTDLSSTKSTHYIGDQEYRWQSVVSENEILDLNLIYGKTEFSEAYAWTEIHLPKPKKVLLTYRQR